MDILSLQEMIEREQAAFQAGSTPEGLMEAAGKEMARRIGELYPHARRGMVLVGKGNNGGDGLVAARYLAATGRPIKVVLTVREEFLGELPLSRLHRLRDAFPKTVIKPWGPGLAFPGSDGVVLDALLGIQARGPLRNDLAPVVAALNEARARSFFRTVALDLPTGLAAFENEEPPADPNSAVIADVTLAVGFAKGVLAREAFSKWVGRLEIIPWSGTLTASTPSQALTPWELARLLPRRSAFSHKGDFGRLAIVAGSPGFTGAPLLCAQAALATGAGLISVLTRPESCDVVAAQAPHEVMVSGWKPGDDLPLPLQAATTVVLGPGLGADDHTLAMLRAVFALGCPVLIDADGLNVLAKHLELLEGAKGPVVLTPHPGEMGRLVEHKFGPDQRETLARAFTNRHDVTLLLKGTRTLITARGQPFFINTTGNPGLSTGGSGDTLSGIIGALLAQKLAPIEAAKLGTWLHGHASDLALVERGCEEGLTPTMLSAHLGAALVSLRAQACPGSGLIEAAATGAAKR